MGQQITHKIVCNYNSFVSTAYSSGALRKTEKKLYEFYTQIFVH